MTPARRRLRKLLILLAGLWIVLLALLYRKPGTRPSEQREEIAGTLAAEAGPVSDRMRFRDFQYVETRGSEGRYRLSAAEALRYEKEWERRFLLKDVTFETGSTADSPGVRLYAPRAEFSEASKAFRVFDGVEIAGEEARLFGDAFRYEPVQRELVSEGPVEAQRGRLVVRAEAATVRTGEGTVVLTGRVRLRGRADGAEPLDLSAPRVELLRGGRIAASGEDAVVRSSGLVVRAEALSRTRESDGDRLRAEGKALLFLAPSAGRLPGAACVAGDLLDLWRSLEGRPTLLDVSSSSGLSELELAPGPREPARTGRSARFQARFRDGYLAEVQVPSSLIVREAAGPDIQPGGGLRTLRSDTARLTFQPRGGGLDVGLFEGGVTFTDGARAVLQGAQATLRGPDDVAVVTGSPAEYRDREASLAARTIVYSRRDERIDASGQVRASWSGERPGGLLGGREGGPVFSESESLRLSDERTKLLLAGNVRAWQKENVLRCETLLVNDAERSLRAERSVRLFVRREAVPRPAGPPAPPEAMNASGDLLTHREADRFVRIEGHSEVLSGTWRITADVTDLRLAQDRAVEFAEARGTVVLEDRTLKRHGEGSKATWRPQADAVTLEGSPATAVDGKGNRTTGALLTFRQGRSQVDVETGTVPSETTLKTEGQ